MRTNLLDLPTRLVIYRNTLCPKIDVNRLCRPTESHNGSLGSTGTTVPKLLQITPSILIIEKVKSVIGGSENSPFRICPGLSIIPSQKAIASLPPCGVSNFLHFYRLFAESIPFGSIEQPATVAFPLFTYILHIPKSLPTKYPCMAKNSSFLKWNFFQGVQHAPYCDVPR